MEKVRLGSTPLSGLRSSPCRAGKSSCIKTVFQDVAPTDVPYFDSTQKVEKVTYEHVYLTLTSPRLQLIVQLYRTARNMGYPIQLRLGTTRRSDWKLCDRRLRDGHAGRRTPDAGR